MLDAAFWRGRRVFLTGHTGFKGSWLSLWLDTLGAKTTGYALSPPTVPSLFQLANVAGSMRSMLGDVRDFNQLKRAIDECQPDVVVHLAAQSVVYRGYEDPIETYSSNVMGTVHLLEALRRLRRPCAVVIITSDKCYENREWLWSYRENERMGGRDPYSSSKGCAELVTAAFRASFFPPDALASHGIAIATARAGNVIGGGDWTANQLIPDIMRAFLAGQSCLIRSPTAIRPWQFVLEPLHGYLLLAERLIQDPDHFSCGWNFGPADVDAKPVAWVADVLQRLWGDGAAWVRDGADHPHEDHCIKLDASCARASLGWQSYVPLPQALRWIVEWYRGFQAGVDSGQTTRIQIERYTESFRHGTDLVARAPCNVQ